VTGDGSDVEYNCLEAAVRHEDETALGFVAGWQNMVRDITEATVLTVTFMTTASASQRLLLVYATTALPTVYDRCYSRSLCYFDRRQHTIPLRCGGMTRHLNEPRQWQPGCHCISADSDGVPV
jgi:hypothetical protein